MRETTVGDVPVRALRVTFVGELGWELHCSTEYGAALWRDAGRHRRPAVRLPGDREPAAGEGLPGLGGRHRPRHHARTRPAWRFAVRPGGGLRRGARPWLRPRHAGAARQLRCLVLDDPRAVALGGEPVRVAPTGSPTGSSRGHLRRLRLHGRPLDRLRLPAGRHARRGRAVDGAGRRQRGCPDAWRRLPCTTRRVPASAPDGAIAEIRSDRGVRRTALRAWRRAFPVGGEGTCVAGSGTSGVRSRRRQLLYDPTHSLIEQSRPSMAQDVAVANADGFGLGWYGRRDHPAVFRSELPALGRPQPQRAGRRGRSRGCSLAHVRAATGTPVQQTNCHPFRHGRWLFVHNGFIADFHRLHRELLLAVRPDLFAGIDGLDRLRGDRYAPGPHRSGSRTTRSVGWSDGRLREAAGGRGGHRGTAADDDRSRRRSSAVYAARCASGRGRERPSTSARTIDSLRLLYPADERCEHFVGRVRAPSCSEPLVAAARAVARDRRPEPPLTVDNRECMSSDRAAPPPAGPDRPAVSRRSAPRGPPAPARRSGRACPRRSR